MRSKLTTMLRAGAAGFGCAAVLLLVACGGGAERLTVNVLSSPAPDLVSGGDALIEVIGPRNADISAATLTLNGADVTGMLAPHEANNSLRGVISGLELGDNQLVATLDDAEYELTVVNYPITGPILSGPHMAPYECRTVESGLGEPLDADCSVATRVDYFYRTTDPENPREQFKPLTVGTAPADLAMTTTIDGETVPYIVKVESGTINRTIYRIAMLDDPTTEAPEDGWNGRLAVSFGGGAGTQYNQGSNTVTSVLSDQFLSRGFAHINATELVNGLHGNAVLQGEALMMIKEHFIEEYGPPKWTVGNGGSGGAIQQLLITSIYPGLLDGLRPSLSFPDSSMHTPDCGLLENYWDTADPEVWTEEKRVAVHGYTPGTCEAWERSFVNVAKANYKPGCRLNDESLAYDAVTNPTGARCAVQDMRRNVYGTDPETGFAYKAVDNVGLQYGLKGLNDGVITVEEFLDLNEKVGGYDLDGSFIPERSVADIQALEASYRSGLTNTGGGGLANVPIIHYRGYTDPLGDIHDRHRDLTIRARLDAANGRSDNQIIWVSGPSRASAMMDAAVQPEPDLGDLSLDVMTQWLDAIAEDGGALDTNKVVRNKPPSAVDAYWDMDGNRVDEVATFDGPGGFNATYPNHWEPRLVAGAPLTNDVYKCQLKAVNTSDYRVTFSAEQEERLNAIFPDGVCDFSKPAVGLVEFGGPYQRY
jgi:hypothetical protein